MLLPFYQDYFSHHHRIVPPVFHFYFLSRFQRAQNRRIRRQVVNRLPSQLNQDVAGLQSGLMRRGAGEGVVDAHAFALIGKIRDGTEAGGTFFPRLGGFCGC